MIKKQTEVKVYRIDMMCDRCGAAMEASSTVLLSYPPQYTMLCKCGNSERGFERYPKIVYEDVEEKKEEN